jgi:hypothetical protein
MMAAGRKTRTDVPSHHRVDHEAIFVHEVQALKRGRKLGATQQRNLNRSRYYSRKRLKKATKRQYPCSLLVPWKGGFEN